MKNAARLLQDIARRDSTVLVVDEEDATRQIAQDFFMGLGCRVVTAHDLSAAAAVLRSVVVDLVIARYDDERAQSAASALRACAGRIPIIALSAGADTLRILLATLGRALEKAMADATMPN
jgi:CheY-like chemotaxis protein